MLEIKNLKIFSKEKKGRNLIVSPGEIIQCISNSGEGKTKLFKILTGTLRPISGEIFYDKIDLFDNDFMNLALSRKKIGAIFETPVILSNLTLDENIQLILNARNIEHDNRLEELIDIFELKHCLSQRPINLSKEQVLAFSYLKIMISRPKFIFIDDFRAHSNEKIFLKFLDFLLEVKMNCVTIFLGNLGSETLNVVDRTINIQNFKNVAKGELNAVA
ncbi:MAG: hypothetical protein CME61_05565 [Halobacteriovoraceae bacterium]|nr:hypothetical protein [Halobacteriovoraceae bacterium]